MTVDEMNGATTPACKVLVQSDSYETAGLVGLPAGLLLTAPAGADIPITAQTACA